MEHARARAGRAGPQTRVAPKWSRFEQTFSSSIGYTNPIREAELLVTFTGPLGQTQRVRGFWDGGRTWRVRFRPDQAGQWNYRTVCSDQANAGLDGQSGTLRCAAPAGQGRFERHGPIHVARNNGHFEHADGTPFFWLADTSWNGARLADSKEWAAYALIRQSQNFDAIQSAIFPGLDADGDTAFSNENGGMIHRDFFRRLDARFEVLNHVDMLSVIAPVWAANAGAQDTLSEEQATALLRYAVARCDANDTAWLLDVTSSKMGVEQWKRVGKAVFGGITHAPVAVFVGTRASLLDDFKNESWVDAFGFEQAKNAAEQRSQLQAWDAGDGPESEHRRPMVCVVSALENQPGSERRVSGDDVRHNAWANTIAVPLAGFSYGAYGVADWDRHAGCQSPRRTRQ